MPLIVPKPSTVDVMKIFRDLWNLPPPDALKVFMFINDYTPDEFTLRDDLDAWAPGGGDPRYAVNWTVPTLTVAGRAQMTADQVSWTKLVGPPTAHVYGYFVTKPDTVTLYWAQRFSDGPYSFINPGDVVNITPTFAGRSEF